MNNLPLIILLVILVTLIPFLLIFLSILHFRKKTVIQKVTALSPSEKKHLLDHLAEPLGYIYDPCQDIFATRLDAPQKIFGYTQLYDLSAPYFNMIFDYETIYFNYNNRTWLIEMWKGQYGINTGCELGVYYADTILSPANYPTAHFEAVQSRDMLDISLKLNRHADNKSGQSTKLAYLRSRHWWLTIFKMGYFTKPQDLFVNISIRFRDYNMMYQFLESFRSTLPEIPYKVNGLTVYFTYNQSTRKYPFFRRFVRRIALFSCRLYCKWFHYITRPFSGSGDKILYLYFYLPFVIRRLMRPMKPKPPKYRKREKK